MSNEKVYVVRWGREQEYAVAFRNDHPDVDAEIMAMRFAAYLAESGTHRRTRIIVEGRAWA